jgi:epoxyqueuosine reductase
MKNEIVALAKSQGADLVGVATVEAYSAYGAEVLARLQETGATAKDYMLSEDARIFFETLADVRRRFPPAKAIVIIGAYSFDEECDYRTTRLKLQGKTARTYAYYPVVRQIAEKVASFIKDNGLQAIHGQQIPLKYVASRIGLGSYGRNGLLFSKRFGSYVALRAIITDAELESDTFEPPELRCEECGRCLKACPTGALYAPYKVNPALCINPLTRKEDDIPRELRRKMGNWVCGCDICQEVCPMNQGLKPRMRDPRAGFDPSNHDSHRTLRGLARCPNLRELMENAQTPVMKRNAVIALANIGTGEAMDILRHYKDIATGQLAEYIDWAIGRIAKQTGRHNKPSPLSDP